MLYFLVKMGVRYLNKLADRESGRPACRLSGLATSARDKGQARRQPDQGRWFRHWSKLQEPAATSIDLRAAAGRSVKDMGACRVGPQDVPVAQLINAADARSGERTEDRTRVRVEPGDRVCREP